MNAVKDMVRQATKTICIPIHPAGWPFIFAFALVTILLSFVANELGYIGLVLTLWCVYFFRNPVRVTPERPGLIVSPSDGVVSMITKAPLPPELETDDENDPLFKAKNLTRVSVFLNVFDVHVNRIPVDGTVTQVVYHPGKFLNANMDKASLENERNTILMKIKDNKSSIAFVQIAGFIARRILCDAKEGTEMQAGEHYGIIRFGSRMDIYLPPRVQPSVIVGQRMIGGETVIADLNSKEKAMTGTAR